MVGNDHVVAWVDTMGKLSTWRVGMAGATVLAAAGAQWPVVTSDLVSWVADAVMVADIRTLRVAQLTPKSGFSVAAGNALAISWPESSAKTNHPALHISVLTQDALPRLTGSCSG